MNSKCHFRDLQSASGEIDYVLLQQVERDICFLYHQLADYPSHIMGDLYYGSVYQFSYWEFLQIDQLDPAKFEEGQQEFIRDGCLVMILAMAYEQIDRGVRTFIDAHIPASRKALRSLAPRDEKTVKLVGIVLRALDVACDDVPNGRDSYTKEFIELCSWVLEEYVQGYFLKRARSFGDT